MISVIAFLIGFGSAWLYLTKSPSGQIAVGRKGVLKDESVNVSGMLAEPNAIVVSSQKPGIMISISKIVFEKGGWVVIHENDGTGKPGKILGAQLFDPGSWDNGKVELLRGTEDGGTYYAMLHQDNGDRAFDPKLDTPILGSNGAPIMMEFTASEDVEGGESQISI